jgi:hypothetical protein
MFRPLSPSHHQVTINSIISINSIIYLCPDDGLVIEAETCHLVTLNKINIRNTSSVLTCESLLFTCHNIKIENTFFEMVEQFKYLETNLIEINNKMQLCRKIY